MEGRCETCKWWLGPDPADGHGLCNITVFDEGKKVRPTTLAWAIADSPRAILVTAPDFGCVQWEAR